MRRTLHATVPLLATAWLASGCKAPPEAPTQLEELCGYIFEHAWDEDPLELEAGVINLAKSAASELIGTGVRVNAICPGLIETGMTRFVFERAREKGTEDKIGQLNPLQRNGVPEEMAQVALFLASDDASYVNGHSLLVEGGEWAGTTAGLLPIGAQD